MKRCVFSLLVCLSLPGVNGFCTEKRHCKLNISCCLGECVDRVSCNGFCRYNNDCPNGQHCNANGYCTNGCYSVKDCPTGFACNSAACIKKWRPGTSGNDVDIKPFSKIEESSSILGLLIAGIVALLFFAWICCQCFRFRLRRQDYQLGSLRFDDLSPSSPQNEVCERHICRCDRSSAGNLNCADRTECRLSLPNVDGPPRYSTLFCDQSPTTPPPSYDEALRIVRLTQIRTSVFIPSSQGTIV